jgi:VWFA-related protein
MILRRFACLLLALPLFSPCAARSQKPLPTVRSGAKSIHLDVVVDTKSGQPVTNLTRKDFVILDNKSPRPITSFKVMTPAQEPVEVVFLLDAVNIPYQMVAYARQGLIKFLRAGDAKLAYPTSLAVLTDNGVMIAKGFSTDGNALSNSLAHYSIGLREINRTAQWGGLQRLQICVNSLQELDAYAARLPGRKLLLWISPGWPLISGPQVYLDAMEERETFNQAVALSTSLRKDSVTLYDVNPIGANESLLFADYYQDFLSGATSPGNVQLAALSLQVLSAQSGGLVFESENDIPGMIRRCLLDAQSWYAIRFDPPPADKPNQFHQITVKLDRPGLIVRTRNGYYSNPRTIGSRR